MKEKILIWIAWKLPRSLVKWATIRLVAYASQGRTYEKTIVPELGAMEALQRWDTCQECGQKDVGQYGEYPCRKCGIPTLW